MKIRSSVVRRTANPDNSFVCLDNINKSGYSPVYGMVRRKLLFIRTIYSAISSAIYDSYK